MEWQAGICPSRTEKFAARSQTGKPMVPSAISLRPACGGASSAHEASRVVTIYGISWKCFPLGNFETFSIEHRNLEGSRTDLLQESHLNQGLDRSAHTCFRYRQ